MTLKFQNTKEDYYKSLAFIYPKTYGFRWYIVLTLGIMIIFCGTGIGILRYLHRQNYSWYTPDANGAMIHHEAQQTLWDVFFTPAVFILLGIVYIVLHFLRARTTTRRTLKRQQFLLEPTEVIFSEEGIEIKRISTKVFLEWVTVKSVYERPEFFGILFTGSSFIPIMKKHLKEMEIAELRKLLNTKKEILIK
jgi:hypothetical protein